MIPNLFSPSTSIQSVESVKSVSESPSSASRQGVLAGGNFIVDQVKLIDHWPAQDTLANIGAESRGNGGGPYNVLKDLALLGARYPLSAAGLVGDDANGRWIADDCRAHGIDTAALRASVEVPTSYTDVMTVREGGRRTFFHQRGANARLTPAHFDFTATRAKWFYLGYLGLLDELDQVVGPVGHVGSVGLETGASVVLQKARQHGLLTCADMVSAPQPRFRDLALAAGPHLDALFVNEIETGYVLGHDLRGTGPEGLTAAATELRERAGCASVVLHCEHGAVVVAAGASPVRHGSLRLPEGFSQGSAGAGDAFAAGYLHGLHEEWPVERRLQTAMCAAALCLTHPTCSGGLRPLEQGMELAGRFGYREW